MRASPTCGARKLTVTTDIRWCNITQSGVLRFDGSDAQSFLQGQLTNNINALTATRSQYAGYCTPKGRLLASLLLWQSDGAFHLMLPRALCEPVKKRLSMYILRAKVKAADISNERVLLGVTGAGAAAWVADVAGAAPMNVHDALHTDGVSVLNLPTQRFLIVTTLTQAPRIEAALAAATAPSPATLWDALDIEAGIACVVAATQEQFVPQTVNYDLINAVSFDKGCYPGQEIVARMHYLGRVKQRMVRARLRTTEAPQPGDKLYAAPNRNPGNPGNHGDYGDQASGMIVSACAVDTNAYDVLAVVQTSSLENFAVHWRAPDGPALEMLPLPYAVK